MDTQKL